MIRSIASKEGFTFDETLTGFKWIGNRAIDVLETGTQVIFCFEESIGFMAGANVLDKEKKTSFLN
jgi:phosphomannomutase